MATLARSAPLPEKGALVEDPQFQEALERSRSLTRKLLLSVTDTHQSHVYTKGLLLNSSDNSKLDIIASNIGIPPAPVIKAVSENFILETCLAQMTEGLELHRALLSVISPHLENNHKVTELISDIRDLAFQINKMLKTVLQPNSTAIALHLTGEYEVQVAAHLTLSHLQDFGQDIMSCFRSLDQRNDEELDS